MEEENKNINDKVENKEDVIVETRTLEELLLDLRKEKNWTYINIIEEMQKFGIPLDETQIKKWELGLEYPNSDILYKFSELYMIPVENLIMAKSNSYAKGMASIHRMAIKWICYITGFSITAVSVGSYIFLGIAFIYAVMFFLGKIDLFFKVRGH